ncbi:MULTISPECIES: DUF2867 domain-containing protein [unclassified Rhizobium]|uniref:DUF2867 domain-containing protein n=1 Tax=unclassified Rhizobium TaxID=2613769 RepID=UPI0006454E77|nr:MULTISPECIES: DUF2867 domain-containing protein [unclassified Rhizobium]MBN8951794.1 DUF2867 domain-containing protein [Rhizobium tropici]OJY73960.1 MAG: hypothetical protein BGP09_26470 [Rhizobium sp. 60-20]RKD61743.1 uncharacterized protein DUF2867 [Rhizobium sp. WW_1]
MSARPSMVKPHVPHPALPGADWADCYELRIPKSDVTAMAAARAMLGRFPLWVRLLLRLRDAVAGRFGLRTTRSDQADGLERIGFFPVVSQSDRQVVLGFDDRHLDFRVVIDVRDDDAGHRLVDTTTLVRRKILLGRIYIALIAPFHRLIVTTMLADFGKRMRAISSPTLP